MSGGDIYQTRIYQNYGGQDLLNVFYHVVSPAAPESTAIDLSVNFRNDVWNLARALQVPSCTTIRAVTVNGMNNADYYDTTLDQDGLHVSSSGLAPNIAAGFRSQSAGPGTRYAYKRVGGVVNSLNADGTWTNAYQTIMAALGVALGSLLETDDALYVPCTVTGGFALGVAPTLGRGAAAPWSFNAYPSHQDTRQTLIWVASA